MKPKFSTESLLRFILLFTFAAFALAQQPTPPPPPKSPPLSSLERYRHSRTSIYMNDFADLPPSRDATAALPPPAAGENRLVFFGDSITDMWHLDESFPGKPYVNR